ncbi:MAG: DUF4241 domain-containing protein [Polyangiaceae bacterium]
MKLNPDFARYLFGGVPLASVGMEGVRIERRALSTVELPDGRVHACDPLVPVDVAPLAQRLPSGDYQVVLFVIVGTRHAEPNTKMECNAAAALLCGERAPLSWELASREGGAPDAAAYGVDAGTGCFMGSRALELLVDADDSSGQRIMKALESASGAIVSLDNGSRVAVFSTGIGDGIYNTWLGRDEAGEPAMLLTDFATLDSESYVSAVHAEWAARKAKKWWQVWK